MNVTILHDAITESSRPDEVDALRQAELIAGCLRRMGHRADIAGVNLDLEDLSRRVLPASTDLVFNLVETLGGYGSLCHAVPALLEARDVPFTGNGSAACLLTTNKPLAKTWLHRNEIPTPPWRCTNETSALDMPLPCSIIVKPTCEDASVGIEDDAVICVSSSVEVEGALEAASRKYGEVFAEQYIDGREFNLSLLCDGEGVEVLPVAEIEFVEYPTGKPRIVGYQAKWDEASFEYGSTPRRFGFPQEDQSLLSRLRALAVQCWDVFGLRGYARVDFRVDDAGQPWVLEVNANPCLSADAGFMAAANRQGLTAERVIEQIVAASFLGHRKGTAASHA